MELVSGISNYGILIIIAGIFLYEHFSINRKTRVIQEQNTKLLTEMQETNKNTAKALEIIQENQNHMVIVTERIEHKIDCVKKEANICRKESD